MSDEMVGVEIVFGLKRAGNSMREGDAEAALVDGAFSLAAAGGFFDEAAVVGGVPEEGIVGDL